jgi:hypothetical protein
VCPLYRLYCLQEKLYSLDLNKIRAGDDKRTTLMVKNIPNKYTQKMLLAVSVWCPHVLLLLLLLPACLPAWLPNKHTRKMLLMVRLRAGCGWGRGGGGPTHGGLEALQALRLQQLRKLAHSSSCSAAVTKGFLCGRSCWGMAAAR